MSLILAFHKEHLNLLAVKDDEPIAQFSGWKEHVATLGEAGPSFTLEHDGRLLACGGVIINHFGVGHVWMVPSSYVKAYGRVVAVRVKRVMEDIVATHHLHRLETACYDGDTHQRWMAFLGFEAEGKQRKAGFKKADLVLYGRVF